MKGVFVCLGLLAFTSALAHADSEPNFFEASDFGTVVECISGEQITVRLLSVLEAQIDGETLTQFSGTTYQEKFTSFVNNEIAPYNAVTAIALTNYLADPGLNFLSGYQFPLINGETVLLPIGCTHRQLAILGDGLKYVNNDLFEQLSTDEQAMFLVQSSLNGNRSLARKMYSTSQHHLSRIQLLTLFGEFIYVIPERFSLNITRSSVYGGTSFISNLGNLEVYDGASVMMLDKGLFAIYQNSQSLTIQGQAAQSNSAFMYFHPTGEVCAAFISYFPSGSLNLMTTADDIVEINSPGFLVYDTQSKVVTIPGTVTPIRDDAHVEAYCRSRFN